jgi:fimbrial chaperone protein
VRDDATGRTTAVERVGVLVLACLLLAGAASGASFGVFPVRLSLTRSASNAILVVRNNDSRPLRLEITVSAWRQTPTNEFDLGPTDDIAVFPKLVTIAGGQDQRIRLAATKPFGGTERSYRLSILELPPVARRGTDSPGVRMLARYSIPVFLPPEAGAARLTLDAVTFDTRGLALALSNAGTVHLDPMTLRIRGVDVRGGVVFEGALSTGYVLTGQARTYRVPVPDAVCGTVHRIVVERPGGVTLSDAGVDPPASCTGGSAGPVSGASALPHVVSRP